MELYIILGVVVGAGIFYTGFMIGRDKKKLEKQQLPLWDKLKPKRKGRVIVRTEAEEADIEERLMRGKEEDNFERSKRKVMEENIKRY